MHRCPLYDETHRPQFHFTPKRNWTNDPNGLVYYQGEYHLFFQHNPVSVRWGNMTWGHAVSPDLVHWEQLANAIEPDELGTVFSGSAVVDWRNTAGFQQGDEKALVAFFTSAGDHAPQLRPFTQSIAYSVDRGRSWTRYAGNPVLGHIRAHNRDPKVIWHEPSGRWVMALYLDGCDYALYGSADLKRWQHLSDIHLEGASECPDFFPLPVDGDPAAVRWVFWGGNGSYAVGAFDGRTFVPEGPVRRSELGANGYAAQSWSDLPPEDGRRIQISWMSGGRYPAMPFNQQMSFPVALSLDSSAGGVRLYRWPVQEIERLRVGRHAWCEESLLEGKDLIPETSSELFDIEMEVDPGQAQAFGVWVRGLDLCCDVRQGTISFLDRNAPLPVVHGRVHLRTLVDRTSLEVFADQGQVSMSSCFLPEASDHPLVFYSRGGSAQLISLAVHELRSAWR
jgi:sucrose-6-phosphate hydrolase SacC (GH32 family)